MPNLGWKTTGSGRRPADGDERWGMAPYRLCQVYENEPWHDELRPDPARRGCPGRWADPTHDPRVRR
jgi:hypothetical protein